MRYMDNGRREKVTEWTVDLIAYFLDKINKMKYLMTIFIQFLVFSANSQVIIDSHFDSLKLERDLEILHRSTRSHFDSRDRKSIEFIFDKIKAIKKNELEILASFETFFAEDDTPFIIVYDVCETLLKEYKNDIIIKFIWEHSDLYKIDYNAHSISLKGDIFSNYPVRTFIYDNKSLFLDFLVRSEYFSKDIPDKEIPLVYTMLQNFINDNGELNNLLWLRDTILIYSFHHNNNKKIKDFYKKYNNK
jgi:hypothetical protein